MCDNGKSNGPNRVVDLLKSGLNAQRGSRVRPKMPQSVHEVLRERTRNLGKYKRQAGRHTAAERTIQIGIEEDNRPLFRNCSRHPSSLGYTNAGKGTIKRSQIVSSGFLYGIFFFLHHLFAAAPLFRSIADRSSTSAYAVVLQRSSNFLISLACLRAPG